jgi:hypothetical protein
MNPLISNIHAIVTPRVFIYLYIYFQLNRDSPKSTNYGHVEIGNGAIGSVRFMKIVEIARLTFS